MFGSISRSIDLIKASLEVLKKDKEIMLFPVLTGITTILLLVSFIVPIVLLSPPSDEYGNIAVTEENSPLTPILILSLFAFYFLSYFIVIFFNVGLITCAHIRLNGGDPTVSDGLNNAFKNIGKIFVWALIAATIGLLLKTLQNAASGRNGRGGNFLAQILVSAMGMAWSLLTFFVVPIMVFEGIGPFEAIKRSGELLKKTWGEQVVGGASIGFIFFILMFFGGIVLIVPAIVLGNSLFIMIALVVFIIYVLALSILKASIEGIFNAALYIYAKTGKVPEAFEPNLVQNAFQKQ
ncbi:MAG: DUF6159 family protein [Candidatus Diapherotrites archaeon]